jgi:hypothetical protein
MIRNIVQHVAENWGAYIGYAIVAWLFVGWPVAAWLGRRRRRKALRDMLGAAFANDKCFARWNCGIAVNDEGLEFAYASRGTAVLCCAEDILTAEFKAVQNVYNALTIETKNANLPHVSIPAYFVGNHRLAEVGARLNAMRKVISERNQKPDHQSPESEGPTLEQAVLKLTEAVISLADVVKQLRSPP